ncbi:ShlB/FhaC/HecB family hemolysin secretion/activation protein [Oryzifoliimicrobium ureilyticus]|uniref:ShlB/FhaC/HecB family hemolysin secretion/activation protein n=1 Tax=Oryzifoliimicrobium ureilyticus TaxID=3113724 RepID=UPI003076657F
MRIRYTSHLTFAALLAIPMFVSSEPAAFAQTASQITPPTFAPQPLVNSRGRIQLPATQGLNAPAGAEKLFVTPSGVEIDGAFPELRELNANVEQRLMRRKISGAEIFAAARDLEQAYANAGYILARVSVPPQTISNGSKIKLVVTDGYIEAIDASAFDTSIRPRVEKLLAPLIGKRHLQKREIERRVLLAGDIPGVTLRSTLRAGSTTGSTILVLNGRFDAVSATLSVDDGVSKELGRVSVGSGVQFNNMLGLGEQIYLRANGYPHGGDDGFFSSDPRNRLLAAGIIVPFDIDGLSLNLEGTDARTHPESDAGFTLADHFQRFSTRLNYDWWRGRDLDLATNLIFDVTRERQTVVLPGGDLPFTEDRLRVLRLSQSLNWQNDWGGVFTASLTGSFGLSALGAREGTGALPLSRDGAEPDFQKLDANWRYIQPFANDKLQFTLSGRVQTSFGQTLVSSEQMSLGGFDGLSSYASGKLDGDAGALARLEVAYPLTGTTQLTDKGFTVVFAPYLFAAGGVIKLESPTAAESGTIRAASYGLGIQTALAQSSSDKAASLSLEYARGEDSQGNSPNRFNLRLLTSF